MKTYAKKQDLLNEINKTYVAFVSEFTDIADQNLHLRIKTVDKTPFEMLAYQIGWLELLMSWEKDELAGKDVILPAPGMKWNNLGKLYQSFYEKYQGLSLAKLLQKFAKTQAAFVEFVAGLAEDVLFGQNKRKWASSTPSQWPVWKWLHINSVAPFTNFRAKIRKWKKGIN
ncbi:protein DUF1706 [Candidatus Termititenax persephonae]|uniref:Protein DUF1706 n=1 Tax=Candidatus Termititenax persephonae TaxID=2218525 RepID=A0A388TJS9_9BACT|nr:protein DUF1706 [Candidatus Termititenax persephonae]